MTTYRQLLTSHLEKIEGIASRLLRREYNSAQDSWNIQLDLVKYQIQLREDIGNEDKFKKEVNKNISEIVRKKEDGWKTELQKLQSELINIKNRVKVLNDALILAKQLGDTFAYLFFKGREQKIVPLAANHPNPPIPSGFSLQVMLAVATQFFNGGAGFPIIHDITNFLRIGDITFCNIIDKDDEPLTVEIKARKETIDGDIANVPFEIYAIAEQPKFVDTIDRLNQLIGKQQKELLNETESSEAEVNLSSEEFKSNDSRLERQVERMRRARKFQNALHREIIEPTNDDEIPVLPISLKREESHFHWDVIRELIIKAKSSGYAAHAVDDAFLYSVTYTNQPLIFQFAEEGILPSSQEMQTAIKEKLPMCADSKRNFICFRSSFDYYSGNVPPYIMPFFLYEIPIESRIDILWGRLTITVMINVGKIVEALVKEGIDARIPNNDEEFNTKFIPIKYKATLHNGSEIEIQGGNLNDIANRIGFEFMSVDGFVYVVKQFIDASIDIMLEKIKVNEI